MARGKFLIRNLGLKLDDVRAGSEQGQRLFGSPNGSGESARLHDPLEPVCPDSLTDPEKSVSKINFRRLVNEETRFDIRRKWHDRPAFQCDSATPDIDVSFMDGTLTHDTVGKLTQIKFRDPVSAAFIDKWNELARRSLARNGDCRNASSVSRRQTIPAHASAYCAELVP